MSSPMAAATRAAEALTAAPGAGSGPGRGRARRGRGPEDVFPDSVGHPGGGFPYCVARQMGVARGGLDPRVARAAGRSRAGFRRARARGWRRNGANRGSADPPARPVPAPGARARRCRSDGCPARGRGTTQGLPGRRGIAAKTAAAAGESGTARGPGLGIAQPDFARLRMHVLPAQRQDFVAPAAGQASAGGSPPRRAAKCPPRPPAHRARRRAGGIPPAVRNRSRLRTL